MLRRLNAGDRFIFGLMQPNRPSGVPALPNDPPDFQVVDIRRYKLRHSRANPAGANYPNASPVEAGVHATAERNFVWLPWLPGKVSYIPVAGNTPIVTGEMTGCWLVLFRLRGALCFGHIGTEGGMNTTNSVQARQAWKIAERGGLVQSVKAFQPRATAPGADKILGALSTHNNFYTLNLTRDTNTYRVLAVTRTHRQANSPNLN
jgi:hypothetical protein